MAQEYIERREGGYYFIGRRVSLDSAVYQFLQGESPEAIVQAFPSLSLEQVYGGITFYLAHRAEIDAYLEKAGPGSRSWPRLRATLIRCCTPSWRQRDAALRPAIAVTTMQRSGPPGKIW